MEKAVMERSEQWISEQINGRSIEEASFLELMDAARNCGVQLKRIAVETKLNHDNEKAFVDNTEEFRKFVAVESMLRNEATRRDDAKA